MTARRGRDGFRIRIEHYPIIHTIEDDRLLIAVVPLALRRDVYDR